MVSALLTKSGCGIHSTNLAIFEAEYRLSLGWSLSERDPDCDAWWDLLGYKVANAMA